jgi:aspartyl-tRNA synthetase
VKITKENQYSWTKESPLTKLMGLELSGEGAVASGGAEVGDIIWLAQRKKIAEGGWTQLGRLRVAIAETLAAKGESLMIPIFGRHVTNFRRLTITG